MIGGRLPFEMGGGIRAVEAGGDGTGNGSSRMSGGHITGGIGGQGLVRFFTASIVFYGRWSIEEEGGVLVKKHRVAIWAWARWFFFFINFPKYLAFDINFVINI